MEFLVLALIGGAVMGAGGTAAFLWPKLVRAQSTLAVAIAERDAALRAFNGPVAKLTRKISRRIGL